MICLPGAPVFLPQVRVLPWVMAAWLVMCQTGLSRPFDIRVVTTPSDGAKANENGQEAAGGQPESPPIHVDGYEWLNYLLTSPAWPGGGNRLIPKWKNWQADNAEGQRAAGVRTVLVLGDTTGLELPGLELFVRQGGTLVVASDSKLGEGRAGVGNALSHLMGCEITGENLRAFEGDSGFQKNPRLVPVEGDAGFPWFKTRPGLAGPLVSNAPSRIRNDPFSGRIVARYQGVVELMPSGPRQDQAAFAAVCQLKERDGLGRVVLLADPEILCNQMLTLPGNLAFACNLAEWIATDGLEKGKPRRDQLLLVVNGQVVEKPFVPPVSLPDLPMPNIPAEDLFTLLYRAAEGAVQAGEGVLARVEDENIPDRAGAAILRFLWPGPLLVMASIAVGFWLFLVLTRRTLNQDMADLKKQA
jgi:hypothetical protein